MVSKHVIKPSLVTLFSMFMMRFSCSWLFSCICNFYIAKRLRVCYSLYPNSKVILTKEKYLPYDLLMELRVLLFTICASICFVYGFIVFQKADVDLVKANMQIFIITLLIWSGILFPKKLTESEILYLSSVNNLTLGYGFAIWYYKNYLDRILPEKFLMRVKQYEKEEGVELLHKLYILCPRSCKVKQYIDQTDYIDLAKDLPTYEIDHGGISGRKYNISVYLIKYNGENFRCAIEYAQPLKNLLALKENGKISSLEMDIERDSFIKNLTHLLKDHKNSFEVCELVQYDDDTEDLLEVLSGLRSEKACKNAEQ